MRCPEHIENQMNVWRAGIGAIPKDYINYHKELAEKDIFRLKSLGYNEVEKTREMASDGWMDGMRVIHIQMVRKDELLKLHWHDGNKEFFAEHMSGCSSPLGLWESRREEK